MSSQALVPVSMPWFADDKSAADFIETKGGGFSLGFSAEEEEILLGGSVPTNAGMWIGPGEAQRISAALACRRVISEDIAKMPRALKRITLDAQGRVRTEVVQDHPVAKVLGRPNEWMTGMEFFEWLVGVATFQTGAYALITRDERGKVLELLPLVPGAVSEECIGPDERYDMQYRVSGYGPTFLARPGQLLRLRGPLDGSSIRGLSISGVAREAIGLAAALEQSQARFHAEDMRPAAGILTSKAVGLKPEQREEIRAQWESRYKRGGEGGIAIMDGDWEFKSLSPTSADSQVIENRRFQIEEICRFFRVFPQIIGHNGGGSGGYNGHEQILNAHGEHTLLPWVLRLEQALERDLLSEDEYDSGLRIDIDQDAVKRGTLSDRVAANEKAVRIYKTPNEIRVEEGLDPIDDPAMNRVQLPANNTGLAQSLRTPIPEVNRIPSADAAASAAGTLPVMRKYTDLVAGAGPCAACKWNRVEENDIAPHEPFRVCMRYVDELEGEPKWCADVRGALGPCGPEGLGFAPIESPAPDEAKRIRPRRAPAAHEA